MEPQADFQGLFLLRQREEPLGLFRLLPERGNAAFQLADNVLQTQQIVLGLVQLALGVLLAVAEPGNPRGLLKDFPAVLGTGSHNAVDFALADYRVAVPAQARIHKELVNVFQAHGGPVNEVLAFPGAVVPPGNGHGVPVKVELPGRVVDGQGHLRIAQRLPGRGAAENHILHPGAAQGLYRLFSQHPPDGVTDIAFSASVGAHHRGNALFKAQGGFIREGFEALKLQRL